MNKKLIPLSRIRGFFKRHAQALYKFKFYLLTYSAYTRI